MAGLAVAAAACGGSGGADPQLPTAPIGPSGARSDLDFAMESSNGLAPAGFKMVSHVDPKAGEDGVIREGSPVTVTFDLCDSTVDDGGHPWFLFDFDFNHVPDVIGKTESCRQTHTYRIPVDATRDAIQGANFCFTNADPSKGLKGTYFSCRSVRIGLPDFKGAAAGCYFANPFWFSWPGGTGPTNEVVLFDNPACQPPGEALEDQSYVVAPTAVDARQLCGQVVVETPFHIGDGTIFQCGPEAE